MDKAVNTGLCDVGRNNGSSAFMKNIFSVFYVLLLFTACGQSPVQKDSASNALLAPLSKSVAAPTLDSTQLSAFVKKERVGSGDAGLLQRFYKDRAYQYAWFTNTGIAQNMRSFWALHNTYIQNFGDTALQFKALHHDVDALLTTDSAINLSPEKKLKTELELTNHFFLYLTNAYSGKADPAVMQWYIPRKKLDAVALLNSFLSRTGKNIEDWEPVNLFYRRLKKELLHYTEIEKGGGWNPITLDGVKTYKPGDSSGTIKQIKERLQIAAAGKRTDTSFLYDNELLPFVKSAQKSFGLKEDGLITTALIKELNVSVEERIRQVLINLERMRWLPEQPGGEFIAVNIPEFRLHVFEGDKKLFSIDIVVGQAAHNTVIFADKLQYVVFSPYWNVPPSIVQNEILPAIRRNKNYLAKNNMEQTGSAAGLPVIRQKPGGENALGKVKFIFPNSYNIYFHDTPAKSLFSQDARAFSHGCMRLAEPVKLATWLLRKQPEWTTEKMNEAMNASVEKWVTLKEEVPVYITYFTAWVDSDGLLNFRKDIYSHDKQVAISLAKH